MINEKQMTLAVDWHGCDVSGWYASEKIFDCRVMWDGAEFWTRSGRIVPAPKWFKRGLPKARIDGGIYAGRGGFQTASKAVRLGGRWFEDGPLEFVAFDFPDLAATWDKRIAEAARALRQSTIGRAVEFFPIEDYGQITKFMRHIRPLGGEGMCFRNPSIETYETGRSKNLLRFKFVNN